MEVSRVSGLPPKTGRTRDGLIKREHVLRKLLLRAYWDVEGESRIDRPLGDVVGAGFAEYQEYHALVMGMSSGGFYCYFSMPFGTCCCIEITNQRDELVPHFYYAFHNLEMDALDEEIHGTGTEDYFNAAG